MVFGCLGRIVKLKPGHEHQHIEKGGALVDSVVEDVPMMETESNSSAYKAIADKSPVSNGTTVHIGADVHRQAVHTI